MLPVLSKAGCNAGACHASQYGKGGFKLSVFSFAPNEDFDAITRDRQARRVNLLEPEQSLFLLKPTLAVPHGGNRRLTAGSVDYELLKAWLAGGTPGLEAGRTEGAVDQGTRRRAALGRRARRSNCKSWRRIPTAKPAT